MSRWRRYLLLFIVAGAIIWWMGSRESVRPPRICVVIALDTCRADHLGCYGNERSTTPNIDRLSREGAVFEEAFAQSNESLFSYASLFTSLYPRRIAPLTYDAFALPAETATLASLLQAHGFATGAFTGGGNLKGKLGFSRGFDSYFDRDDFASFHSSFPPAREWLREQAHSGRPVFLFLHGYDAHLPYSKPMFFNGLFDPDYQGIADSLAEDPLAAERIYKGRAYSTGRELAVRRFDSGVTVPDPDIYRALRERAEKGAPSRLLTTRDVEHLKARYDGSIAYADVYVGLVMAELRSLGLEREAVVAVVSDHGEDLMEHGFLNHRSSVNDSCVRVPLVLWAPGLIPRGIRVKGVVQLVDLRPTLLDYLGLRDAEKIDGVSLRPLVEGKGTCRNRAFSQGVLPMCTVRTGESRLICLSPPGSALPPPGDDRLRLYRIERGREVLLDSSGGLSSEAARLRQELVDWSLATERAPGARAGEKQVFAQRAANTPAGQNHSTGKGIVGSRP